MLQVPPFPGSATRPGRNLAAAVALTVVQVLAWFALTVLIMLVLMVVVACSAFGQIMQGGGPMGTRQPPRRW